MLLEADTAAAREATLTSILAAIIRLMETLIPPASGSQKEIDRIFDEMVAGFETA